VGFTTLGAVAFVAWHRRRDQAAMWAAAAFGSLALLELISLVPAHAHHPVARTLVRVQLELAVLFPYFLFRFTRAFRHFRRRAPEALGLVTLALAGWSIELPAVPRAGEHWGTEWAAFVAVLIAHWVLLSGIAATSLWRAGAEQPSVARRRIRLMAGASGVLALALVLAGFNASSTALSLGAQAAATVSVATFLIGFSPPKLFRVLWHGAEQERMQQAIMQLLTFAESQEEIAGRVLEPAAAIVGARAIVIRNADRRVVASWQVPGEHWEALEAGLPPPRLWPDTEVLDLDVSGGSVVVWTSPYAPFFGDEELSLLHTVGALTGLALDRVRLFQAEHDARVALERANDVKLNFIALAAHELRTPMTTIHGFVTTLHHLSDRLDDEQRTQVSEALLQQSDRMVRLVEQLLDLSRLDAEAIEIAPEPIALRPHLEEIVAAAAPIPEAVQVDVPPEMVAIVDRHAVERIVANLVTNAFRYGLPPVIVRVTQTDRHLRLVVEDRGSGVPSEFVPDLFERFTRSDRSRETASGTGLGLAIARSYARAHGGDLLYEDAVPHGARFQCVLPVRK
jgi:signal transduction histidine kinase